jgi:predicted amidophosphoribosyltransferase
VTTLFDAAADLLLGATCPGCGEPSIRLCAPCAEALTMSPVSPHHKAALGDLPLWAAGPYEGLASRLITAAKDRHRWDLVNHLAPRLAAATTALLAATSTPAATGPVWLVPIPSAQSAIRRRGFDFGGRLALGAQRCLNRLGVDARAVGLLRTARPVADQSGLTQAERVRNLDGAYGLASHAAPPPRWAPLILVDDVATTGTSLAEARRVLTQAGGTIRGAATVASTRDRDRR